MKRLFIFLLLTCVGVARADASSRHGVKKPRPKASGLSVPSEGNAELRRLMNELGTDKDALMKAAAQKPTVASNTAEETKLSKSKIRRLKKKKAKESAASVSGTGSDVEADSDTSPAPVPVPVVHKTPTKDSPWKPVSKQDLLQDTIDFPPPVHDSTQKPLQRKHRSSSKVTVELKSPPSPVQVDTVAEEVPPTLTDAFTNTVEGVAESVLDGDDTGHGGSGNEDAAGIGDGLPAPHSTFVDVTSAQQRFGFSSPPSHRSCHSRSDSVADDTLAGLVDDADDFRAGEDALKPGDEPVDSKALVPAQHTLRVAAVSEEVDSKSESDNKAAANATRTPVIPVVSLLGDLITSFDGKSYHEVIPGDALTADAWNIPLNAMNQSRFNALLKISGLNHVKVPESLQVVYLASHTAENNKQAKTAALSILGGSVYGISERPMDSGEFTLTLVSLYKMVKTIEPDRIYDAIYADRSLSKQNHAEHRHNMLLCALAVKADVENLFGDSRMATIADWAKKDVSDVERDLSALETRFDMAGYLVRGTKFRSMEDVDQ